MRFPRSFGHFGARAGKSRPGIAFAFPPVDMMKTLSVIVMQIVALVAISQAGYAVAAALQLPVPETWWACSFSWACWPPAWCG